MQRAQNLTWPCATCPYSAQDGLVSHGQTLLQSRMLLLQLASFFEIPKLIQLSFQVLMLPFFSSSSYSWQLQFAVTLLPSVLLYNLIVPF